MTLFGHRRTEKFTRSETNESQNYWHQALSVIGVSYLCISCGNFLGYTSSAVASMKEDLETFKDELSPLHISWIAGLGPLGALFGSLFTLIPLSKLGSRRTIFFFGSPSLISSFIIISAANSVDLILIGRFIGGFGTGTVICCSPLYVLDVSSINFRGSLGVMPQFLMIFGILTSYILGSVLNWRNLAMSSAIIAIPSLILLTFASDSPNWLVYKSRHEDAFKVLEFLHGTKQAPQMLRELQTSVALRSLAKQSSRRFNTSGNIKASLVAFGILSFQQLTGINGVTFYAVSIFREASTMNAHIPSIILASTQLMASFMSTLFVDRFGRKVLLMISSIIMTISAGSLGCYFYWGKSLSYLAWTPLILLVIFVFGFAIGYGPISWILVVEILSSDIRHIVNPLAIAYNWFCVFLVTSSFPYLILEIQIFGVFWLYAGVAFVGLIFISCFVPETMGQSEEKIAKYFNKKLKTSQETFEEVNIIPTDQE